MHAVIAVTAWSANTTVYYDHWEDGYDFDPANPTRPPTRPFTLATTGRTSDIPRVRQHPDHPAAAPRPTTTAATGSMWPAAWSRSRAPAGSRRAASGNQAAAWEIYPVKPQLTTYVVPFGENLGFVDFHRVFVLVQATADNTTVTVDLNGDGTPDSIDWNRDGTRPTTATQHGTLQRGADVPPRPDQRLPAARARAGTLNTGA